MGKIDRWPAQVHCAMGTDSVLLWTAERGVGVDHPLAIRRHRLWSGMRAAFLVQIYADFSGERLER